MVSAERLIHVLAEKRMDFFTGVPCSGLTPLINSAVNLGTGHYVVATQEGEALAIATGAYLAGRQPVVLSQNSGLGNLVNPLTSLNLPFCVPALLLITWRGQPGRPDEPQHALMGSITHELLSLLGVRTETLSADEDVACSQVQGAIEAMNRDHFPQALVIPAGIFGEVSLREPAFETPRPMGVEDRRRGAGAPLRRIEALAAIRCAARKDTAFIATTGKCGRELHELGDQASQLYMIGAMGSASGVGLGIALNYAGPVVVLDGDGAALMRLGTMATVGAYRPHNLLHVVLDNGVHDSTGGQRTVSDAVSLAGVASACGYATVTTVDTDDELGATVRRLQGRTGPHMVHVKVRPGALPNLGRPSISPADMATRFAAFLRSTRATAHGVECLVPA